MTDNKIEKLADDTIKQIKLLLLSPTTIRTQSPEKASKIMSACLAESFEKLDAKESAALYKKLSLALHPDKLEQNHNELYEYLKSLDLVNFLQQELNNSRKKNVFNAIAVDSVQGAKEILRRIYYKFEPMLFEYKRYIQPVKLLVNVVSWAINIALVLEFIVTLIPTLLMGTLINRVMRAEKWLINAITANQYKREIANDSVTPKAIKAFIEAGRKAMRQRGNLLPEPYSDKMSDEEFMQLVKTIIVNERLAYIRNPKEKDIAAANAYAEAVIERDIEKFIHLYGVHKLTLLVKAFYHIMVTPLPAGIFNKIVSIGLVRPCQLLVMPLILTAAVIPPFLTDIKSRGLSHQS